MKMDLEKLALFSTTHTQRSSAFPRALRVIRTFTLLNRLPFGKFNRVNLRYSTAAFTLFPESVASPYGADSLGDWALYAFSVFRITSGIFDLPSATTFVNILKTLPLTGFTYRGLPATP